MATVEVTIDLESDEDIPFSSSPNTKKVHSFDFETSHSGSHSSALSSWLLKQMRRRHLRSIYFILIKAKINMLLPFGPLAILLHYLTGKHVWSTYFSVIIFHFPIENGIWERKLFGTGALVQAPVGNHVGGPIVQIGSPIMVPNTVWQPLGCGTSKKFSMTIMKIRSCHWGSQRGLTLYPFDFTLEQRIMGLCTKYIT